jgi:L-ascorbate metabolism protein UlaG (beta-lactamase superfamily)
MSESDLLFLRQDVQLEPLFDHWYCWSYLIPPATAARHTTERHLKIMQSYLDAPHLHASAATNSTLLGGPFIDLHGEYVDEIRALRDTTIQRRPELLELSKAIETLDAMLRKQAQGYSLAPLYSEIPEILRGRVELAYDRNHHADFRVIEPLMYRSQYYVKDAQSVMLSITDGDERPFVLSTPRLDAPDRLHLHLPFDSPLLDQLFRLKKSPATWREILDRIEPPMESRDLLRSFFTAEPPRRFDPYEGRGVRWRYFGHACILVEGGGKSLLFDPVISYKYDSTIKRYTYEDVPERIDYVLLTHNHQDHVMLETLLQLRHKIGQIIVPRSGGGALQDPSLKMLLQQIGFENVIELGDMDTVPFEGGGGSITGLPFLGEHSDLNIQTKLAWLIRIGRHKLLFAADSCNIEPYLYERLQQDIGNVDVLFLGMECEGAPMSWIYGSLFTQRIDRGRDQTRRLNGSDYRQAVAILNTLQCKEVYVYAMGQEPWLGHVMGLKYTPESKPIIESNKLLQDCQSRGIVAERLFGTKEILCDEVGRVELPVSASVA